MQIEMNLENAFNGDSKKVESSGGLTSLKIGPATFEALAGKRHLALRQGFGRLIRTQKDRGIVAVLDKRVRTKAYGARFLASLPDALRVGDFARLEAAWARISGAKRTKSGDDAPLDRSP